MRRIASLSDAIRRFATAAGVSPASWTEARRGWSSRIHEYEDVREAYARLYRDVKRA